MVTKVNIKFDTTKYYLYFFYLYLIYSVFNIYLKFIHFLFANPKPTIYICISNHHKQ